MLASFTSEHQLSVARRIIAKCTAGMAWPAILKRTRMSAGDRDLVLATVEAHLAGSFPLPPPSGRYSKAHWRRGLQWIKNAPYYQGLLRDASTWDTRMRSRLGAAYDEIFGTESDVRLGTMLDQALSLGRPWEYEFSPDHAIDRTPAALAERHQRMHDAVTRLYERMTVLSNLYLYDPSMDPDWKLATLRETQGRYDLKALLRAVHGLRFRKSEGICWEDIAAGRITIAGAMQKLAVREAQFLAARKHSNQQVRLWLGRALDLFDATPTRHLGALNAKLHKHYGSALKIERFTPKAEQLCLRIAGLRYLTSHIYGQPCNDVASLVHYLAALYEEMAGQSDIDDDCYYEAEARAGRRLQEALQNAT